MSFLHDGEQQCSEGQHADATRLRAAANARMRRIDRKSTSFQHSAGNESERALGNIKQGRWRSPTTFEFFQHHASAVGYAKNRVIDEANADPSIGGCLDDVALADSIANFDLNGSTAGSHKDARANYNLDFANSNKMSRVRRRP